MESNVNLKTIHDPIYHRLIELLRGERKRRGLRQVDVAKKLGVSRTWVSKMETCELRVDILQLTQLCRVCELRIADVVRKLGL